VHYNTQQVLTKIHKGIKKTVPSIVEKLEKQRQIKVARTRKSRQIDRRQKKLKRESGSDRHYGPQSQKSDLPDHIFEQLRQNYIEKSKMEKLEAD